MPILIDPGKVSFEKETHGDGSGPSYAGDAYPYIYVLLKRYPLEYPPLILTVFLALPSIVYTLVDDTEVTIPT